MLNTNNDIKLGIADDNKFFRETLSDALSSQGFKIIFEAVNRYDCIDKIKLDISHHSLPIISEDSLPIISRQSLPVSVV